MKPLYLLITELKKTVVNESDISAQWRSIWTQQLMEMEQDLGEFKSLVDKLNLRRKARSVSGLNVRLRTTCVISGKAVARHKSMITSHLQFLQIIQDVVNRSARTAKVQSSSCC